MAAFNTKLVGVTKPAPDLYLTPESRTKLKLAVRDSDDDVLKKYGL